MYTHEKVRSVEEKCYDQNHVDKVMEVIKKVFPIYFNNFLECEAGDSITINDVQRIEKYFGVDGTSKKKSTNLTKNLKNIIIKANHDFEKDREAYIELFDYEALAEYEDDIHTFKSKALKNECPIIRHTIQNKRAKVLDKYRADFYASNAAELHKVVLNLSTFAVNYIETVYAPDEYDKIVFYKDLELSDLDTNEYTVYGVIGGGIKSHMLYKVQPSVFPNRSRFAIWALWYLTEKNTFGCEMDSEFLMIDTKATTTQQNYFYPYELFAFYAHQIFQLLKKRAVKMEVNPDPASRYILVDAFLTFVAECHIDEIELMTSQIKESWDV